jgi:hypothetical protein
MAVRIPMARWARVASGCLVRLLERARTRRCARPRWLPWCAASVGGCVVRSLELVAAVVGTAVPGLHRRLGGRPGFLLAWIGLVAAGPLPGPAVDPRAGPLAILEIFRASAAGPTPWPSTRT